jgi:phosphoglycolate phosphatase
MIKLFGIDSKFTHIKGASNFEGGSKVDEGHTLLSMLEYKTSRILFVGDTMHDYEVACSLGVQCALIAKGHQSKERLGSAQALLLDSHEELLFYL